MRLFPAIFVVVIACAGCANHDSTRNADNKANVYIPSFKPIPEGFRPTLPYYHAETTFRQCEALSGAQLGDIQDHFAEPLCERYYHHIAAIVINGCGDISQTTFTIWLLNGSRLESGYIFLGADGLSRSDFNHSDLGRPMYRHALKLLRRAISESQLKRAKNAKVA